MPWPVLIGDRVESFGQPVRLVVADSFEQARAAANLIVVDYVAKRGAYDLATNQAAAYAPRTANGGLATDSARGDLDQAMAEASVRLNQVYTAPHHFAQPMEPQACLARWDGDGVWVWTSLQSVQAARSALSRTLRIPPAAVHIDAAYVGGGFGSKIRIHEETVFAALAARELRQLGLSLKADGRRFRAATSIVEVSALSGGADLLLLRASSWQSKRAAV